MAKTPKSNSNNSSQNKTTVAAAVPKTSGPAMPTTPPAVGPVDSTAKLSQPMPTAQAKVEPFGIHIELPAGFEKVLVESKPEGSTPKKPGLPAASDSKAVKISSTIPADPKLLPSFPVEAQAGMSAKLPAETSLAAVKKSKLESFSEDKIIEGCPDLKLEKIEGPDQAAEENAPTAAVPQQPQINPMYVVMIASELAPVAKVGGLGDVVYGLARELEIRGNAVEIILPKYNNMRYDHIWGLTKVYENLWVPWYGGSINTSVWFGFVHGRKCFFIEPHSQDNFFNRGVYYGHSDDVLRFAFFCRAALEFMHKSNKHPEVIHCHDWQTALVPVLLYEMYQHLGMRHSRVCFTVHNFRHQGMAGSQLLQATGLNRPEHFFSYDRMRDNKNASALNLTKAGIVYSNFTTTVSPRHAWEAKDAGQGDGLEPTLQTHHHKFGGVLNGLDYEQFNPETDAHIPAHYNVDTIQKKYENKKALRNRFWLADNEKPIVAFIGRLDQQKGLELVRHSIFYALNNRAQFVLLGSSPERAINDHFIGLKRHLNDSPDCHLEIAYHEELARLIYAGADMMIVPSRYEPCGLTQLISLRYGTVPIVRSVGGLADTVFDKDFSNRPLHERNGYVFHHADNAGMESALYRAIGCYYEFPEHWRHLMLNGMRCDYSWNNPGSHYLNIYDYIRDK